MTKEELEAIQERYESALDIERSIDEFEKILQGFEEVRKKKENNGNSDLIKESYISTLKRISGEYTLFAIAIESMDELEPIFRRKIEELKKQYAKI